MQIALAEKRMKQLTKKIWINNSKQYDLNSLFVTIQNI